MEEVWVGVKGYEETHSVSNRGRVLSKGRYYSNNGTMSYKKARILKSTDNGAGYLQVRLNVNGKSKSMYVHRLVAMAFVTNLKEMEEVHHKDHDKTNNCHTNLEWSTRKHNMQEMVRYFEELGVFKRKEYCGCGGDKDTYSIRCRDCDNKERRKGVPSTKHLKKMLVSSESIVDTARKYGVSRTTVVRWCKRKGLPYKREDLDGIRKETMV